MFDYNIEKAMRAFEAFLHWTAMDFVLDEDNTYTVGENSEGQIMVFKNGKEFDERWELFVHLRRVCVKLIPNLDFRTDEYISYCGYEEE